MNKKTNSAVLNGKWELSILSHMAKFNIVSKPKLALKAKPILQSEILQFLECPLEAPSKTQ